MTRRDEEVRAMVKRRLQNSRWRVTVIYARAQHMSDEVSRMTVEQFRREYIVPILRGNRKEDTDAEPVEIDVPGSLHSRLKERMSKMDKEQEDKEQENHAHECPSDGCIGGSKSRAGLARHIDTVHPEEAEELRAAVGFDPGKAAKPEQREPLILSREDQEQILELLDKGLPEVPAPEPGGPSLEAPTREQVRTAFLEFARETRDTADPLDVVGSLETYVDLVYDLFTGEAQSD